MFFGRKFWTFSGVKKTSIKPDTILPSKTKGRASIIIDRKTPIMEICFIMVNKGITRLYVVDDGKYYGMIKDQISSRKFYIYSKSKLNSGGYI